MAREDSGSSSGGSLTSDEEGFENIPEGLAPTYHTEGVAPTYRTAAPDIPAPTGRPSMDRRSQRPPHSPAHPPLGPAARRFKAIAQKVIHLHRTSKPHGAGAEPGIDPRRSSAHQLYGHLTQLCTISVIDYNAVSARFREFDNAGLRNWFRNKDHARPAWARVRWIHVNAISWDVLSMLALEYEMHPLALEDVLHSRSSSRSKTSYYSSQLFIRVLCHTLSNEDPHAPKGSILPEIPRSESPVEDLSEKGDPDATLGKNSQGTTLVSRDSGERWHNRDADVSRLARQAKLQVLREQDHRVLVDLYNLFIFLKRDGTVITVHAEPGSTLFDPIKERLRARDTILRRTADPSLLVESVLDLVVDEGLDIVDRYQETIGKLEAAILGRPKMRLVRALHVIAADLALLKRSLDPVKSLVFGLRRYDLDRCIAVAHSSHQDQHPQQDVKEQVPVVGFMSHKAKIYLADVYDHIEYVLGSMDLFAEQAENLISYTFNMSGYQTNETMRRLTLVTIICLPLTLLTGYFGQNFEPFPGVNNNSDLLFWEIALPMMAVLIPLFLWSDIVRGVHKVSKLMAAKRAAQEVKASMPVSKNKYQKKRSS